MLKFGKHLYVSYDLSKQTLNIHDKKKDATVHFTVHAISNLCNLRIAYFIQRNRRKKKADSRIIPSYPKFRDNNMENCIKCSVNEDGSVDFSQNDVVVNIPSYNNPKLDRTLSRVVTMLGIQCCCNGCTCCPPIERRPPNNIM